MGVDVHIPGPGPTIGAVIPTISALLEDVLERERGVDGPDAILGAASVIEQEGKPGLPGARNVACQYRQDSMAVIERPMSVVE
jgi:hypothetical protein